MTLWPEGDDNQGPLTCVAIAAGNNISLGKNLLPKSGRLSKNCDNNPDDGPSFLGHFSWCSVEKSQKFI